MTQSPPPTKNLRRVGSDDWPAFRQLRLEALGEAAYAFSSKLADWQGDGDTEARWRARLSSVPFNIIADLRGAAAGMVSATAPDQDGAIELISLWVAPFARGQGVGDLLVTAVIDWARTQSASSVVLAVTRNNPHATALYIRHGFVDAGPIDCSGSGTASERQMVCKIESTNPFEKSKLPPL